MLLLYNGNESGSREARLLERVPDVSWGLVRRNAVRILRTLMHESETADVLENLPFVLWKGTNGFGDQFELLHAEVPIGQYLQIELQADSSQTKAMYELIARAMAEAGDGIRFIGIDADKDDSATIVTPILQITSVAVIRALSDFEVLVSNGGPISGVDRLHTVLHGYLKAVCDDAGIVHSDTADITTLFGLVRDRHPKFQVTAVRGNFRGEGASIVDSD